MAFYNIHNLRVGVAIDDEISCIKKGEFVFYQCYNDYNSNWPVSVDIITEFMEVHQRDRHLEDSPLIHILDIELAFKNLEVIHIYILSKLLGRGKALIKMLEDRKREHPENLRSGNAACLLPINSDFLRKQLKLANSEFSGPFPYSINVWRRDIFSSYKCTAMYVVQSDKDMETKLNPNVMPVTVRKADLVVGGRSSINSFLRTSFYGLSPFADAVVKLEHNVEKEENYMKNFLKNIEYLEVSAKRAILEAQTRSKSYAIYYPEMEITDSIADELIFILIDMYNSGPCHKIIFNPENGTTTCDIDGRSTTVKCHGDDEFSLSKGYLAALAKASKCGNRNWLSELKNHRKVHILPKLED